MAKYGEEITQEICGHIESGMTKKDAATLSGISEQTLYDWIKKHSNFSQALQKAETKAKKKMIDTVRTAAIKTWQAAAWWLERKHKDEFALRTEHTGKDGQSLNPPTIQIVKSSESGTQMKPVGEA